MWGLVMNEHEKALVLSGRVWFECALVPGCRTLIDMGRSVPQPAAAVPAVPSAYRHACAKLENMVTSDTAMLMGLALLPLGWLGGAAVQRLRRERERLAHELHDVRVQSSALAELLEVWHWRSDSEHRLTLLHPPQGASDREWSAAPVGALLWDRFIAVDPEALRTRLNLHAALLDVSVRQARGGDAQACGSLRAAALQDVRGRFMGYVGTWRESLVATTAPLPMSSPSAQDEQESFSYTVSHDLRAPIRVVEGFTKIVKEDYGRLLDRIGNDHLDRVLGAAARMNSMIDALLALSQLSTRPLAEQPVNLSQLANFVADDLRRQSPEREVKLHIEAGMQVQGDPTLLRIVLENLLGNAWKYTAKCSEPAVWFERSPQSPHGGPAAAPVFCVRDNGAGFDMRFSDRLFGVFQRLHSANDFQGTGVGLASVRRIVRRHGGEIWAEAEVGRGAAFHFSLARP
jgi:signal transduction histidine kinase